MKLKNVEGFPSPKETKGLRPEAGNHFYNLALSEIGELECCLDWEKIDIESICEKVHQAYCNYCVDITGKEYWTKGDYSKLSEDTKEADRYTVMAVLKAICSADVLSIKKG